MGLSDYIKNRDSRDSGSEAVIPAETAIETPRIQGYQPADNHEARMYDLDSLETKRSTALANILRYQSIVARAYNKNVKPRKFQVGDLVWRKADILGHPGKLEGTWEGPYKVVGVHVNGSYDLEEDGNPLRRPWNGQNLQKYNA